jgi:hypothetical protein
LIGTAHGTALENLMLNPTLSDLVGGIGAVTLSDEEARRRGTQKTVLERKAPPTFDVLVEIQTRNKLVVHEDVAASVDAILRGRPLPVEVRTRNEAGEIEVEMMQPEVTFGMNERGASHDGSRGRPERRQAARGEVAEPRQQQPSGKGQTLTVYAYGVARNRLQQAARRLKVPLTIVDDFSRADAIVTLKNYYRRRPKLIVDAERRGTPIYVLRANTVSQMENFLSDIFELEESGSHNPFGVAMDEVKTAIRQVRNGAEYVDLSPQESHVRRRQHEMAHKAQLASESYGDEPRRFVRIFRNGE